MDRKSLEENFVFEEDYWWFLGRRRIVRNMIRKFFKDAKDVLALDAGCGTGIVLKDLEGFSTPVGLDRSEMALEYTKKRGSKSIVCGDVGRLPFRDGSFDLITVLGVLYNKGVTDDDEAIKEIYRILKKDGIVIVDEAAYEFLQSKHNIDVGGVRRYTRKRLTDKCERHGFKVLKSSHWNAAMLPFFSLAVLLDNLFRTKRHARLMRIPRVFNSILKNYLYLEAFLLKYVSFPFGPSITLVAKK